MKIKIETENTSINFKSEQDKLSYQQLNFLYRLANSQTQEPEVKKPDVVAKIDPSGVEAPTVTTDDKPSINTVKDALQRAFKPVAERHDDDK